MIRQNSRIWPLITAVLLYTAACGKKDGGADSQPDLSAPSTGPSVAAQAEVKASSGPVEITLLIHKTQLKSGDYLWQQIRLKNIGTAAFAVVDPIFRNPRELRRWSDSEYGTYLEAYGPDGRRLKVSYTTGRSELARDEEVSGLLEVEGSKEKAMLDGWKKQGLSQEVIDRKLLDFNLSKRSSERSRQEPALKLLPGQTVETKSAFYYSVKDEINNKPVPLPVGEFAQVDFFRFDTPGEYKVRAVYDHTPTESSRRLQRQFQLGPDPSALLVHTPWIAITVLP